MFDFDVSQNTDNAADEPGGINATINETMISKAKEGKFAFCKLIQAHKRILFGKLSSSLTTLDKKRTWQIIHSDLVTAGYHEFITEKNWKQLRDTTWGTLRKRAAEKRDRAKQNGKDGGEAVKFSELDKLIFTILDPETLDGTEVSETGASLTHTKKENGLVSMEQISQSKSSNDNEKNLQPLSKRKCLSSDTYQEEINAEILKKIKLENRKLELENRKLELEHRKLEFEIEKLRRETL